jgi:hypothetical protein
MRQHPFAGSGYRFDRSVIMLSPFTTVDHRIGSHLPLEERRTLRRSAPERLSFEPPGLGMLPRALEPAPRPIRPSRLREALGRALIELGERLTRPSTTL